MSTYLLVDDPSILNSPNTVSKHDVVHETVFKNSLTFVFGSVDPIMHFGNRCLVFLTHYKFDPMWLENRLAA